MPGLYQPWDGNSPTEAFSLDVLFVADANQYRWSDTSTRVR
jgi:hypothetical protein